MYPQRYVERLKAAARLKPQHVRLEAIDAITDELARFGLARYRIEDSSKPVLRVPVFVGKKE
jgi:hypothetical protein